MEITLKASKHCLDHLFQAIQSILDKVYAQPNQGRHRQSTKKHSYPLMPPLTLAKCLQRRLCLRQTVYELPNVRPLWL